MEVKLIMPKYIKNLVLCFILLINGFIIGINVAYTYPNPKYEHSLGKIVFALFIAIFIISQLCLSQKGNEK